LCAAQRFRLNSGFLAGAAMRKMPFVAAALFAVVNAAAAESVQQLTQAELPQVTAWRRDLHQHPELSNHEVRTSGIVAAELKKLGYDVRTGIAHTGVVGVLSGGKPGRKLAIRADMDALPVTEQVDLPFASKATGEYLGKTVGVMHACGHDAHTAMTLGVAAILARLRADLPGQVMLIFQPAEEGSAPGEEGGAPLMVKEGLFADFKPDAIFGMHVRSAFTAGTVTVVTGGTMASSDTFRIIVRGKGSHGATPWLGVDPIATGADIVMSAQTIVSRELDLDRSPAVVTFGIFNGGTRFNVVPETTELQGTIRAFDEGVRQHALASLKRVAENVAAAHGASVEAHIPSDVSNPVNNNDPALTARVRASLEKALGKDKVVAPQRWMAAEDFPHLGIAAHAPSVYFFVGATSSGIDPVTAPTNHSPKFFLDEAALPAGTAAMLQAALDFLGYQ
jgi:amidohydrolase